MAGIYKPEEHPLELEEMAFGPGFSEAEMKPGHTPVFLQHDGSGDGRPARGGTVQQDALDRLAENLAGSLAGMLAAAIRDFQEQTAGGNGTLEDTVRQQRENLDAAIDELAELKKQVARLAETVATQEALGASTEQQFVESAAGLAALRCEAQEQSALLSDLMNSLSTRLEAQQQVLSELEPGFASISPRVEAVVERLDRQAEAIRSISGAQAQRDTALDQLVEIFTRMRNSWVPAGAGAGASL